MEGVKRLDGDDPVHARAAIIEVRGVTSFGSVTSLSGVTLSQRHREVLSVIGPTGAGQDLGQQSRGRRTFYSHLPVCRAVTRAPGQHVHPRPRPTP